VQTPRTLCVKRGRYICCTHARVVNVAQSVARRGEASHIGQHEPTPALKASHHGGTETVYVAGSV
jgi:hypothetical protein